MLVRKFFALRVTRIKFHVAKEPETIFGKPNFFKKKYLRKIFLAEIKKPLVITSNKILYKLCIS